jgi:hypothetical protein
MLNGTSQRVRRFNVSSVIANLRWCSGGVNALKTEPVVRKQAEVPPSEVERLPLLALLGGQVTGS